MQTGSLRYVNAIGLPSLSTGRGIVAAASRDAVAKLRLDGTPTPRSWVARMTKRPTPIGAGKSAS